jgi:Flp pilus assembly protein TadG
MRNEVFNYPQKGIAAGEPAMQQKCEAGQAVVSPSEGKGMMVRRSARAQAMVEFALALPIFLLVVYGIMEGSRLIFTYATVATASREAVRYASAAGVIASTSTVKNYDDCAGIRSTARKVGFLLNLQDDQIRIFWDRPSPIPPDTAVAITEYCQPGFTSSTQVIKPGDRVFVNVTSQWTLLVPILPFSSRPISSGNTARTFMGVIDLQPTPTP